MFDHQAIIEKAMCIILLWLLLRTNRGNKTIGLALLSYIGILVFLLKPNLSNGLIQVGSTLLIFGYCLRYREKQIARQIELEKLSITDQLTQTYNRRYFEQCINGLTAIEKRNPKSLSLIMVDIDHFKRVNDVYGHTTGDIVLQEFAKILKLQIRESDVLARLGGEEFVLVLPETNSEGASILAQRVRKSVEQKIFMIDKSPIGITASIGIAEFQPQHSVKEFLDRADGALYKAKNTGRNKIVVN
jgi:diguanylate cyclase (GGDEF)-like protein